MTHFLRSSEFIIDADGEEKDDALAIENDDGNRSSFNPLSATPFTASVSISSPMASFSSSSVTASVSDGDLSESHSNLSNLFRVSVSEMESNSPSEDQNSSLMEHDIAAWAVIDGHGGLNACQLVNDILLKTIARKVRTLSSSRNPEEVVKIIDDAFQDCDRVVLDAALTKVRAPLMTLSQSGIARSELMRIRDAGRPGCCVLILLIIGEYMYAANVGDCRAVLVSSSPLSSISNDKLQQLQRVEGATNPQNGFDTKDFIYDELRRDGKLSRYDSISSQSTDILSTVTSGNDHDCANSNSNDSNDNEYVYEHDNFSAFNEFYHVSAITKDHICTSTNEKRIVSTLSRDPRPFRSSVNDISNSAAAFKRVAGSLAITRAMGDGYLKHRELSFEPYIQYIPYITCRPTIKYKKLDKNDKYLILASDGLYNFVTAADILGVIGELPSSERQFGEGKDVYFKPRKVEDACTDTDNIITCDHGQGQQRNREHCSHEQEQNTVAIGSICNQPEDNDQVHVGKKRERNEPSSSAATSGNCEEKPTKAHAIRLQGHKGDVKGDDSSVSPPTFAELLIERCLAKAARKHGGSLNAAKLKKLPQGKARREIVDDITVITVDVSLYVKSLGASQTLHCASIEEEEEKEKRYSTCSF